MAKEAVSIKDSLIDKDAAERAVIKAQAFEDAHKGKPVSWSTGEKEFTVSDIRKVGKAFECTVRVIENGIALELSNPFRFHNPPIMVPDGTTHTEFTSKGVPFEVNNYKEDVEEALKRIVMDAVRIVTKR